MIVNERWMQVKALGGCLAGVVGCGTIFFGFIFFVFVVGAAGVSKSQVSGTETWAAPKTDEPQLILKPDWKFENAGYGSVYITGRVVNKSGRNLRYSEIRFALTDKAGAQIGTAWTNITDLRAGATWRFKAHVLDAEKVRHANLAELRGH